MSNEDNNSENSLSLSNELGRKFEHQEELRQEMKIDFKFT